MNKSGDKVSLTIINSEEAVREATEYLNSLTAFIDPLEGLKYGVIGQIENLVLHALTAGVVETS